jgi:hypothetical protein
MNETRPLSSLPRRALWLVAVTAALTGFLLTIGAFAYADLDHNARYWPLATGALVLVGGSIGWSALGRTETTKRLVLVSIAILISLIALFAVGFPVAVLTSFQCGEGEGVSVLRLSGLLIPAVYYAIGYYGFAHPRRLLYIWPLAVVAGLFVYLTLDLVWKATSGCGPA